TDDAALVCKRQPRERLVGVEPARVLDLVVVIGGVAVLVFEQEEVDELVVADGRAVLIPREPELDLLQPRADAAGEPRLLGDLARCGLLERLPVLALALRQLPARAAFGGDE